MSDQSFLPAWWRHLLIAVAVLLLCSCQALPPANSSLQATVDDGEPAVVTDAPPNAAATKQSAMPNMKWVKSRQLHGVELNVPGPNAFVGVDAPPCFDPNETCQDDGCCISSTCEPPALVGPRDEYLCDGGDYGLQAAVRADWTVDGLEQEDAVAHYDTLDGRVLVTPSNRVCIYAPRFASVRRVEYLAADERRQLIDIAKTEDSASGAKKSLPVAAATQRKGVAIDLKSQPALLFKGRQQAGESENVQAVTDAYDSIAVHANLEILRTGLVIGEEKPKIDKLVQAAVTWSSDQAVQVAISDKQAVAVVGLKQPGIVYQTGEPNSPWLRLIKCASTDHALPGEEVEFTLRYDNIGDQVIGNVTIVDNLATRLEYVPDSAKSSSDAGFSSVPNGEGSAVLRWEINEPLKPGEGGLLQFRAKVL